MSEQETIWLAYGETAGYVQRASSKERAVREVKDGTLSKRQQLLLVFLDAAGTDGLTWKQLADITALHHGQVSAICMVQAWCLCYARRGTSAIRMSTASSVISSVALRDMMNQYAHATAHGLHYYLSC